MAPQRPRCTATTKTGKKCKHPRLPGKQTCRIHTVGASRRAQPTDQVLEDIESNLAAGATIKDAAICAGIAERTIYDWLNQGETDRDTGNTETPFARLAQAVTRGRARARVDAAKSLHKAGVGFKRSRVTDDGKIVEETVQGDWRAAAHFLERTDPEHWGRRDHVEVSGVGGGEPVVVSPEGQRRAEVLETLRQAGLAPD